MSPPRPEQNHTPTIADSTLEPEIAKRSELSDKQKHEQQQAKDIAYTINHAFACTAVDWFGQTQMMVALQKAFGVRNPKHIGCSNPFHKHEDGSSCGHDHHDHHHGHKGMVASEHLKHIKALEFTFGGAEVVGDFAGVIPTVLMQRYTPWAMDGIRPVLRTTLGPIFHWGAERSTNQWAKQHGIAQGSDEYKEHLNDIYEHEMHHLPQAAWWTAWSSVFNIGLQQPFYEYMATPQIRQEFPLGTLHRRIMTKIGGASLSIGLVLGTRAIFPETAHHFTNWTEDHMVTPLTKIVTRGMGIDDKIVDEAIAEKRHYHDGKWTQDMINHQKHEAIGHTA